MAKNNKNLYDLLVDWRDDRARKENIPESKKYFILSPCPTQPRVLLLN